MFKFELSCRLDIGCREEAGLSEYMLMNWLILALLFYRLEESSSLLVLKSTE